jgi:uncharacterized tellurite resistance protein B-like protein
MLKKIAAFFNEQVATPSESQAGETNEHRLSIATGALLLEIAHADSDFSELEEETIIEILHQEYGLSAEEAQQLLELSRAELEESLDLWQFTNLINQNFANEDKIRVLEILWHVIFADGKVDKYEEYLIRKVSFLLNLEHRHLIEAKLRVKERLGLL